MNSAATTSSLFNLHAPLSFGKGLLWATVITGALDATDGVIFFGIQGLNPIQVLQYIASGALGAASFAGGLRTAALGTAIHFFIAAVVAWLYLFASRKIPALVEYAVPLGLIYGASVYLLMTYIVLPYSAVAHSPVTTAALINGFVGHALFVGLPTGLIARRIPA